MTRSGGAEEHTSSNLGQRINLHPTLNQINCLRRRQKRPILRTLPSQRFRQPLPLSRTRDGPLERLGYVWRVFCETSEVFKVGGFCSEGWLVGVCFELDEEAGEDAD